MHHWIDDLLQRWFIILLVWVIIGVIALHVHMDDAGKKDIDFGAAVISGVAIVYSVLLTVQTRRAASAARFCERWNAVDFTTARREVGLAVRGEKKIEEIESRSVVVVLNFFEEMSISIQMGEAQEPLLRKFFKGVVIKGSATFTPWIKQRQPKATKRFFRNI